MEIRNHLKLLPQLILTPQLKLYLKILPMNVLELNEYLLEEAQDNPFLEIEIKDLAERYLDLDRKKGNIELDDEYDWEKQFDYSLMEDYDKEENINIIEKTISSEETLYDYLMWQIRLKDTTDLERKIAEHIICNLDEKGYLSVTPGEIARELEVDLTKVEEVRNIIKRLDPLGIASLDLKECLLIQLDFLGYNEEDLPVKIVKYYLDQVPTGVANLSKLIGASEEEIEEALGIIKTLEPFPARNYKSTNGLYIIPDLKFFQEDGIWKVEILRDNYYTIQLNSSYKSIFRKKTSEVDKKQQIFLREKMKQALALIKALDQRYVTLYKIGQAILKHQKEYLDKGPKYLKPLTLKILAEETGLHESTISRVINQKYVDTPLGIYSLKYFLSAGYTSDEGKTVSAKAIMDYIKEIITVEDPNNPYSDAEIAKELQKRLGVKIARRTVTKYRELLNIPSTRQRRKKSK